MSDGMWNVSTHSDGQVKYTWKDYTVIKTDEGWTAYHLKTPIASWDEPRSAMAYCELLDMELTD